MAIDFRATMQRYPDEELVRIIQNGEAEGSDPLAINAANEELAARGRSEQQVAATIAEVKAADANQIPYEDQGLSSLSRVAFLFLGFLAFPVAASIAFAIGLYGFRKKSQQAWISISVGLVPLVILLAILILSNPR